MLGALLAVALATTSLSQPDAVRSTAPETWFHVIGGNASKEGVTADLSAIAEAGISGIQFFHGHTDGQLWPGVTNAIPCMSEQWLDLVKFVSAECHRLGLTFKMQNCPGWSMSGGPWITPDKAMRKLVAFEPDKRPAFDADDDYHEIGAVPFPVEDPVNSGWFSATFPNPQQIDHHWAYEPDAKLMVWDGGYPGGKPVVVRECPMGAWQDEIGMTISFPRFLLKGWQRTFAVESSHGGHRRVEGTFSTEHRLDMWEAKAGWGLRHFTMSTNAMPVKAVGTKTLVFGHVNAKRRNHPAPPEATGWECDKMDPRGFEANFEGYLGKVLAAGVKVDGTLVDSWECGTQTWTWKMEEEFAKRNGYALRPWLPALFGYVLKSEAETEKFLLDWRNTCSRLIEENYYGTIARLAHENGMTAQYETAFGDVIIGDILRYWKYADEPMCEFWSPHDNNGFVGSHDFKPVLPCVSAAHIYGKRRVSAEALTSFNLTFDENFKDWKRIVDKHFARGVTHIVFHTYTHNPVVNGKPPSTSFGGHIGSPFLREQTWWPYLKEFTTYLERCGRELERGRPLVDILMYLGDDVNHKPSESKLLFDNRYKYDYLNQDVLMNGLIVTNGSLAINPNTLPRRSAAETGQTPSNTQTPLYRVLWIPRGTYLTAATEKRLTELSAQGARIVRGDFTPDWPSPLAKIGRAGTKAQWYARQDGDETIYFIVEENGTSVFLHVTPSGASIFNPVTGEKSDFLTAALKGPASSTESQLTLCCEETPPWATERTYTGTFQSTVNNGSRLSARLDLGEVRDWATVFVNGHLVRRLWCKPYACDITPFLENGENKVRVEVTSTWYNRLVHEAGLPEAERTTWTLCGPKADAPLHPSGLLNDTVKIIFNEEEGTRK